MHDQEGRAAKRRLLQTGEYAIRIIKLLGTEAALEAWIHYKITKAADYISSVYHYMMGEKALDQMNETEEFIQMSASQLYKTAKYSAKLIKIIDDEQELKDWIQIKIGKAATHLSEVYHYIDFEDASSMEAIEQQKIDKFHTDLDKLVHKTFGPSSDEKKMTKEGSRMPSSMIKSKEKMDWEAQHDVEALRKRFQARADQYNANRKPEEHKTAKDMARSQELRIGREFAAKAPYSRHVQEDILDEGLRDWLQKMAAAGIIIGSLAGIGSVMNAIDNSVPAIQAMNTALDVAQQKGDNDLIAMIKKDIRDAKLRLDTGKDLNQVKYLQDKYSKFMPAGYKKESTVKEYTPFKNRVLSKLRGPVDLVKQRQDREAQADKMATLQNISKDKHTPYDQELKDKLAARLDKLRSTGL